MSDKTLEVRESFAKALAEVSQAADLDKIRVEYLGKKGLVTDLMKDMKSLSIEEKKTFGQAVNVLKDEITNAIASKMEELKLKQEEGQTEQKQVDTIVSVANKQAGDIFREMMKPIIKMIDKAEDMEELQKVLKDEKRLRELYQEMESPELEDLVQQGIYLSHLIGRSMD